MSKLDGLNAQVRSCRLCRLCRTRMNGVPGDGNEAAAVLFIGEGPGYNEDREGKPFVGQAGQFLDELLGIAGLQRREVYITNVVKCRPPQNRDPLPDEIDACSGYLERQIATIDPLLIVTLGRYSMARFFPDAKITSIHGQAKALEGRMVLPMLHPAYGLRDDRGRESLKEDFRRLPDVLAQARELRAARPGPPPPQQRRLQAVVEAHLDTLPVTPAPVVTSAPAAETTDPFAYVSAVTDPARRGGRRKVAAVAAGESATVAVPMAPSATPGELDTPDVAPPAPEPAAADAPITATVTLALRESAPASIPSAQVEGTLLPVAAEQGRVEPLHIVPADPPLITVDSALQAATAPPALPRRARSAPPVALAPDAAAPAATPPADAPAAPGKKGKPDKDFEQLSLFG